MPIGFCRRSTSACLAIALFTAACGSGGPSGSVVSQPPLAPASTAPAATGRATAPAATRSALGAPSSAEPPAASLAVEGGDPIVGQLGSFTWNGGGSDSPWLPGSPITVGPGERLTVSLAAEAGIAEWTARRAAPGSLDGFGAVGLGQGVAAIAFDAPPTGTWSMQLTVRFTGDRGSATYYWKVTVP